MIYWRWTMIAIFTITQYYQKRIMSNDYYKYLIFYHVIWWKAFIYAVIHYLLATLFVVLMPSFFISFTIFLGIQGFSQFTYRDRQIFYDPMSYPKSNYSNFHMSKYGENNYLKNLWYIIYFNMCRITKSLKYRTASIRYIVEIALSKAFYFLFMAGFPLARTIEMWKASSVFARISYCIWWVRPFFLP